MTTLRRIAANLGLLGALLAVSLPALPRIGEGSATRQPQMNSWGTVLEQLRKAHEKGDAKATVAYATMLQRGMGAPADPAGALAIARQAARNGNAAAAIFVAESLLAGRGAEPDPRGALDTVRALARSGNAKAQLLAYQAVKPEGANLPPEDRIFGLEMLAQAADQDLAAAKLQLASYFIEKPGIGNRERARALLAALPAKSSVLDRISAALVELEPLGDSPTTIRLMQDAQPLAESGAVARARELARAGGTECETPAPVLDAIRPARPLADAEFLPLDAPGLQKSYLVRGSWSEAWDYSVCGRPVTVEVLYRADGTGGASFTANAL